MNHAQVLSAIEPLLVALRADGADVEVGGLEGPTVDLRLVLDTASCSDCVMPAPILTELFQGAVREAGFPAAVIRLTDPRES
jgi:hypothetical protein